MTQMVTITQVETVKYSLTQSKTNTVICTFKIHITKYDTVITSRGYTFNKAKTVTKFNSVIDTTISTWKININ